MRRSSKVGCQWKEVVGGSDSCLMFEWKHRDEWKHEHEGSSENGLSSTYSLACEWNILSLVLLRG